MKLSSVALAAAIASLALASVSFAQTAWQPPGQPQATAVAHAPYDGPSYAPLCGDTYSAAGPCWGFCGSACGTGEQNRDGFLQRFFSGYPTLVKLFPDWLGNEEQLPGEPTPARRGFPAPLESPPLPNSEYPYSSPLVGIPGDAPTYPLMKALQGTCTGDFLKANNINVYGWADVGGNASTSRNSNVPESYDIVPNSIQLDQIILRSERVPDSVQTDHVDWGFRFTNLYGTDYRYTTAKGWFSDQLLQHNHLYGWDPLETYGLLYVPGVAQGMIIKVGRYISPPDIEAQLSPDNYLYSRSIMYTYDIYTQTGILAEVKLNDQWVIYLGINAGGDMAPWTTSSVPTGQAGVRWVSKDNNDSLIVFIDSLNDGKYRNQHDNLQEFAATWTHKFNDRVNTATETYFNYQFDALQGGSVINGPPRPFFEAVGPGPLIPGISPEWGLVNFTTFKLSKKDYLTIRNDCLDDIKGQRTGFATWYSEHTIGLGHHLSPDLLMRPELRYEHSYDAAAYDNGTRHSQFTAATDMILRF